ncbi:flagellin N-terminal helical domain-containing protein [Priestia megaterium]|uniref:flagellin N-terminal helical domain-containing protein n=1 Tax=Priestia megaterium TaxID=1404 RepID=UPI003879A770
MRINHNITALNTYGKLNSANNAQAKSMEKLSSGLRINSAADDAAGLAISEKMRGQIRGLDQAGKNAQDSISMIQTAEGALGETTNILQRMRELAVQAGNDSNTESDRGEIQKEMNQLTSEVNRVGNTTEFNSQNLLNGTGGTTSPATTTQAGVYTLDLTGGQFTSGDKITIDGQEFTAGAATDTATGTFAVTDAATQANGLKSLIEANTTLSAKYDVTVDGTTSAITLTQKAGKESDTAPTVSDTSTTIGSSIGTTTAGSVEASAKSSFTSQIGANANQTMTLEFSDMRAAALGIVGTDDNFTSNNTVNDGANGDANERALDVTSAAKAGNAVTVIQSAIDKVSSERSKLGAYQNRLDHTINNLSTSSENLTAAESRIRDTDMAKEMMEQTKNSILSQASQAMLGQANQQPQNVLQLLR